MPRSRWSLGVVSLSLFVFLSFPLSHSSHSFVDVVPASLLRRRHTTHKRTWCPFLFLLYTLKYVAHTLPSLSRSPSKRSGFFSRLAFLFFSYLLCSVLFSLLSMGARGRREGGQCASRGCAVRWGTPSTTTWIAQTLTHSLTLPCLLYTCTVADQRKVFFSFFSLRRKSGEARRSPTREHVQRLLAIANEKEEEEEHPRPPSPFPSHVCCRLRRGFKEEQQRLLLSFPFPFCFSFFFAFRVFPRVPPLLFFVFHPRTHTRARAERE